MLRQYSLSHRRGPAARAKAIDPDIEGKTHEHGEESLSMKRIKTTLAVAVLALLPVALSAQEERSTAGSRANAARSA